MGNPIKIYLATPYTGTEVQEKVRFKQACEICAGLMKSGFRVFSPIAHSHNIAVYGSMPGSHGFWKEQNRSWLEWADEIWVARMHRWTESRGVKWEISWAMNNDMDVRIFTPGEISGAKLYDNGVSNGQDTNRTR